MLASVLLSGRRIGAILVTFGPNASGLCLATRFETVQQFGPNSLAAPCRADPADMQEHMGAIALGPIPKRMAVADHDATRFRDDPVSRVAAGELVLVPG